MKILTYLSLALPITLVCCVPAAAADTIGGRAPVIDGDTLEIVGKRIRFNDKLIS